MERKLFERVMREVPDALARAAESCPDLVRSVRLYRETKYTFGRYYNTYDRWTLTSHRTFVQTEEDMRDIVSSAQRMSCAVRVVPLRHGGIVVIGTSRDNERRDALVFLPAN